MKWMFVGFFWCVMDLWIWFVFCRRYLEFLVGDFDLNFIIGKLIFKIKSEWEVEMLNIW